MTKKQVHKLYERKINYNCDRFIPPRINIDVNYSHYSITNSDSPTKNVDILEQRTNEWIGRNYESSLGKTMKCDFSKRILPFSSNLKTIEKTNYSQHWKVRARQKPIIGSAWAVLDLPNFMNAFDRNLLDWGKCNYIAAALWDSVYLWNAMTSKIIPIPNPTSTAVKWNLDGTCLFTASRRCIKIWDTETIKSKIIFNESHCVQFRCSITAVDWYPYGNVQATGCDHGGVVIFNDNGLKKVVNQGQNGNIFFSIVSISFSFNGRYIASSSFDSVVSIWTFPDGLLYFRIQMFGSTRGLAWHPTQQSYLCLGDTSGVMALWNVNTQTSIALHKPTIKKSVAVYDLTFSELSGELVTSHLLHSQAEQPSNVSQINVLASFDRIVDRIEGQHEGRVLYLKWSPDGSQIATAGSDETLQIWNFTSKKRATKKSRRNLFQSFKDVNYMNSNFNYIIR